MKAGFYLKHNSDFLLFISTGHYITQNSKCSPWVFGLLVVLYVITCQVPKKCFIKTGEKKKKKSPKIYIFVPGSVHNFIRKGLASK